MSKGHQKRMDILKRAAAHLDSVTLDRVWQAALRGDMDTVEEILSPHIRPEVQTQAATWRDSSSWLFGRSSYDRDSS